MPSANQQTQMSFWILLRMKLKLTQIKSGIASFELLYRLWHLSVPRLKSWITSDERFLQEFAWQNLHFFADEAMVLELVQKFEAEYLDGNKYNATKFWLLYKISTYKQIELSNLISHHEGFLHELSINLSGVKIFGLLSKSRLVG